MQAIQFLADNIAFFGILMGSVVAIIALLLGAGILAGRSESTCDDSMVMRVLDALTFWIPVVGPFVSKRINTTPTQRKDS